MNKEHKEACLPADCIQKALTINHANVMSAVLEFKLYMHLETSFGGHRLVNVIDLHIITDNELYKEGQATRQTWPFTYAVSMPSIAAVFTCKILESCHPGLRNGVFSSCCSHSTKCLTKCWNTEESAGGSQ